MDINVSINGIKEPLSDSEARRVQNAVRSSVVKEVRKGKDEKSKYQVQRPKNLQEVPTFLQAFISTTYGLITFFILLFLVAVPASAIGGAFFVANQENAPIYTISDQTDVPHSDTQVEHKESNPNLIKRAN